MMAAAKSWQGPGDLPGRLVVLEGIDGAGTTTQAELLTNWLRGRGIGCQQTAEPSTGPVGQMLRQALRRKLFSRAPDGRPVELHNDVISLLFAADRMDHLHSLMLPLLAAGQVVVCDRYYHSSLVYQSQQGDWEWIRALNSLARRPEVTYVIECPVEVAIRRQALRGGEREIYENEPFQRRLAELYHRLPQLLPEEEIVLVDGSPPAEEVHRFIRQDVQERFQLSG